MTKNHAGPGGGDEVQFCDETPAKSGEEKSTCL